MKDERLSRYGDTRWTVFGMFDSDDLHVFPVFGRDHELEDECWCHPERDPQSPEIVVHNVEQ